MLLSIKRDEWLGNVKNDLLGGLVTAVALIPEVIGFAIIAGVNPMTALFASVITAIVTSLTGGRPAMMSAAAGSMALVMVVLIKNHGIEYMIAATILTGVFQLLFGYLGIHKLMRFISKPVMMGFVNALALLIFLAQIQQLEHQNGTTYAVVGITVVLMYVLPRVTRAVPPALIIIVAMTCIALMPQLQLQTVGDLGEMTGVLALPGIPMVPFTFETLVIITPTALALAFVGLMESLLTLPLINKMTGTLGDNKREVKSQGLANIITGFFGGPAGCAMIGQAVINVESGGRKRLSTLTAGLTLFILIVFFKDVMVQIPTAALIGIMIVVAVKTFSWSSLREIPRLPATETAIMVVTVILVVYTHNLAIGILVGVLLSMVIFIVQLANINVSRENKTVKVTGPLFFVSAQTMITYFENIPLEDGMRLDLSEAPIWDKAGRDAVITIRHLFEEADLSLEVTTSATDSEERRN
ncbi:SulP family inorganic anion transporter [Brochothrix thermosphacta]|uniref:SulP family inorganic anion transporter n=1 Tax=Brochothrix thermosphacta TaxID=2756 RepID=UPI00083FD77C|nr:SulP family inorganic anion transporter [Brochothrix thermosphacta]ODJ56113.1 hypothetical protein BFR41_04370 [Brochothrix thermosphacta]ODJ71115.1 hypothetical protein BFR43_04445 [Brochothrix thermosphacta]